MDVHDLGRRICDEIAGVLAAVDAESADRLVRAIVEARAVFLTGTGRSGWIARCLAVRLTHLGRTVHLVGDATTPAIGPGDLLIACSGSGRTPSVVSQSRAAKGHGATVALITARPDSPAATDSDLVVNLPAPTPKADSADEASAPQSIQPMGTLFEQALLVFGDVLVVKLSDKLDESYEGMFGRHANLE